jgi:F-type H+-transporting ATPase subunit alpha
VNVGLSVSRVGGAAQIKAMRQVAGRLRMDLAQYRELQAFAQFGSELDKATQDQLARGARMVELLKQGQYAPLAVEEQVLSIYTGVNGHLDDIEVERVGLFEREFLTYVRENRAELLSEIRLQKTISDNLRGVIDATISTFKREVFQ